MTLSKVLGASISSSVKSGREQGDEDWIVNTPKVQGTVSALNVGGCCQAWAAEMLRVGI